MPSYPTYLKIETKKYLSFTFFKKINTEWKTFKLTSPKSILFCKDFFADVNKDVDKILSLVFILSIHENEFAKIIIERLKPKSKNSRTVLQTLNYKFTTLDKEIKKIYETRLKKVQTDIKKLKKDKSLDNFLPIGNTETKDISLFGIVHKNNKTILAVTSKRSDEHQVDYIEPKHLVLMIDDIEKPVIIQHAKSADRYNNNKAQAQIIAFLKPEEGLLEVLESVTGYSIETKDDIFQRRLYRIDIDILLAYYQVFNYEKESKEEFEATLSGAENYSHFMI